MSLISAVDNLQKGECVMAGENILKAEMEAIQAQSQNADHQSYDVYINDYGNYGNWYDCKDWH